MRKIAWAVRDAEATDVPRPGKEQSSDVLLQRGRGFGRLILHGGKSSNRVVDLVQRSPIRIMFPTIEGQQLSEAVVVNVGGGITGGDKLDFQIVAMNGSTIAITTQAAEKLYKAISLPAEISTKLEVLEGGELAWLPQETIVFDRAQLKRRTEIDVSPGGEVLAGELLILGRAAHREKLSDVSIQDEWRVKRNNRLIWADTFRLTTESVTQMSRKSLLSHFRGLGTMLYSGPLVEVVHLLIRQTPSPEGCWVGSTIVNGLLVIRIAARDAASLRRAVCVVLNLFSKIKGPGPFQVPKMWSC